VPKTFASQAVSDESGRKGALCRGTIVYEVDDGAQKAPYKLKILARFRRIPISQLCRRSTAQPAQSAQHSQHRPTAPDGVTQDRLSARLPPHSPGNPARRRRRRAETLHGATRGAPGTQASDGNAEAPAPPKGNEGFCCITRQLSCRCYLAFSRISTRRHRLVADSGRVSARSTRSPMPALFSSS
jgi:hypothetical protein